MRLLTSCFLLLGSAFAVSTSQHEIKTTINDANHDKEPSSDSVKPKLDIKGIVEYRKGKEFEALKEIRPLRPDEDPNKSCSDKVHQCFIREGRIFVGVIRTIRLTAVSTSTTTIASVCAIGGLPTTACGRRRRKLKRSVEGQGTELGADSLIEGSMDTPKLATKDAVVRVGRLVLYTSTTTTVILTMTSFSGTFSVSFVCTVSGAAVPNACR